MKIIFTGGHHTSALEVAKELLRRGHEVYWVGHESSMARVEAPAVEYEEVKGAGIRFIPLRSGKPAGYDPWWQLKLAGAFLRSLRLLRGVKPDLVVGWGGYLSVPVVTAAWLLRTPALIHEQTRVSGRANRVLARFAAKIMVAWPDVRYDYPKEKTVVVGLPLRREVVGRRARRGGGKTPGLLVLGGKQGSRVLNEAVFANLETLLEGLRVFHQCGFAAGRRDLKKARRLKRRLPGRLGKRYFPEAYFDSGEMGRIFAETDLVLSRAGAHVSAELLSLEKPALLVPAEIVPGREQQANAEMLVDLGLAEVIAEADLKSELLAKVAFMFAEMGKYRVKAAAKRKLMVPDSLERTVLVIEGVVAFGKET
jgi:UDP-N-acetylglucosamine--N-acetylmuramyl-(pentapeptide) pyrophosphoryl-undecaprenol N-acetylglucosamine transferase